MADSEPAITGPQAAVFMGPRASFWPFYLRDSGNKIFRKDPADYNNHLSILAGRKRYPLQTKARDIHNPKANADMKTCIRFLEAGTRFRGRIRFHNLHPVELGALLWAVHLGHKEGPTRHAIGRAKAFGYGRLKCEYTLEAKGNGGNGDNPETRAAVFMKAFEKYMEDKLDGRGSWRESVQIRNLKAMSTPTGNDELKKSLEYMNLGEYVNIKKDRLRLPDYLERFEAVMG